MILSNLKVYAKFLSRNKLYTFVSVLGFSISLMFVIILGIYVKQQYSYDNFQENKDRIYLLDSDTYACFANPLADFIKDNYPEVESYVRVTDRTVAIGQKGVAKQAKYVLFADSTFFNVFSFKLLEGNPSEVLCLRKSVVISKSYAQELFSGENPIGKPIIIDNREYTVTGLMENMPQNTIFRESDMILSYSSLAEYYGEGVFTRWAWANYNMFFLAREGTDLPSKAGDICSALKEKEGRHSGYYNELYFVSLKDVYFINHYNGMEMFNTNNKSQILIYTLIVVLILLIALLNYINLTVAQAGFRGKESSIRRLLGCDRKQIITQILSESLLMAIGTFIIGIILAFLAEPFFNNALNTKLELISQLSASVAFYFLLFILGIAFISGIIPALVISSTNPLEVVKGTFRRKVKTTYSKILIIFQYTIVICLLICSTIIKQQCDYLVNFDTGFNRERILVMDNKLDTTQLAGFREKLLSVSGVENVSYTLSTPIDGVYHNNFETDDGQQISYQYFVGDTAFLSIFGIHYKPTGIAFAEGGFWLNQKAYDLLANPKTNMAEVGFKKEVPVLGVIDDFRSGALHRVDELIAIKLLAKGEKPYEIVVKISNNADLGTTTDIIKQAYTQYNGGEPFDTQFVDNAIQQWYNKEKKISAIMSAFTILTIVIMVMGIFAMSLYMIRQKEKEISIRKVNGATEGEILFMLNKDNLIRVLIAFVIAAPIAYYVMTRWLEHFAYKIQLQWWVFSIAGIVVIILTLLSVSWQIWKAARANPVDSIKSE